MASQVVTAQVMPCLARCWVKPGLAGPGTYCQSTSVQDSTLPLVLRATWSGVPESLSLPQAREVLNAAAVLADLYVPLEHHIVLHKEASRPLKCHLADHVIQSSCTR